MFQDKFKIENDSGGEYGYLVARLDSRGLGDVIKAIDDMLAFFKIFDQNKDAWQVQQLKVDALAIVGTLRELEKFKIWLGNYYVANADSVTDRNEPEALDHREESGSVVRQHAEKALALIEKRYVKTGEIPFLIQPASVNGAMKSTLEMPASDAPGDLVRKVEGGDIKEWKFLNMGQKQGVVLPNGIGVQLKYLGRNGLQLKIPEDPQLPDRKIVNSSGDNREKWFYNEGILVVYRDRMLRFYQIHADLNIDGFDIHEDFLKKATGLLSAPDQGIIVKDNSIGRVEHLRIDGHRLMIKSSRTSSEIPIDLERMHAEINTQQDVGVKKVPFDMDQFGFIPLQKGLQRFFLLRNCQIAVKISKRDMSFLRITALEDDPGGRILKLNIMFGQKMSMEDFWMALDSYLEQENLWVRYMPGVDKEQLRQELLTGRIILNRTTAAMKGIENGGIDLNQISVNHVGKKVKVQFNQSQLSELMQGGFKGFGAVITDFQYIQSFFQLLGINSPSRK